MGYFVYNDKFFSGGTAIIEPANRGMRYGDGLFETMKIKDGKLLLADEHFARLWKGMQVLGFDIPKHFTPEKLADKIMQLAQKNGHANQARIRLQVLRGNGGLYDAVNHLPNYFIETWALQKNDTLNSNGLELGLYRDVKKCCDIISNLKHCNYLPYVLAALYAQKQKWNDALLMNQYGRICDSTIANVFIVKNNSISTPALSEGCVAGTMREHVIRTLKKNNLVVIEGMITEEALGDAEEVFLTNSIHEVRWVKSIGKSSYTNKTIQEIYSLVVPTIQ